jgi:hypothetical protein
MQSLFKEEEKWKSILNMSTEIKMHETTTETGNRLGGTAALHWEFPSLNICSKI